MVQPLALDDVQKAILKDEATGQGKYETLEKILLKSFSSVDSLNASFSLGVSKLQFSSPNISFSDIDIFYTLISSLPSSSPANLVLSACLGLVKRPKHKLSSPTDMTFLLLILENPALYTDITPTSTAFQVLERTVCILSNLPKRARHYLLNWFLRFPTSKFQKAVEAINVLISVELSAYNSIKRDLFRRTCFNVFKNFQKSFSQHRKQDAEAIPITVEARMRPTPTTQPTPNGSPALSTENSKLPKSNKTKYGYDWKLFAYAKLQAILFNANSISKKLPISAFYNTMVDYIDIKSDFSTWEQLGTMKESLAITATALPVQNDSISQKSDASVTNHFTFAFCQFPFMLSMGAKTQLLEFDARRQMKYNAHAAMAASGESGNHSHGYLYIPVRREHILEDSFQLFETRENDLRKAIRVKFLGEPGIDVGGVRKEWFLLLMRELFSESKKLFEEDEDSKYCWFRPDVEQSLKYYKLTGVTLGLALYNSTILDSNFAPVLYKKLLNVPVDFDDFKEVWPVYGKSLQQILDYEEDDFEEVFCLSFSIFKKNAHDEKAIEHALVAGGEELPVTQANKKEYVNKIVQYYLETSIEAQFLQLKQGFFKVAESNALTLFQPSELALLISGSGESLDVKSLRSITKYKYWAAFHNEPDKALVVKWFWRYFESLDSQNQRKLLMFVTGSDRIPATGISTMKFTITRAGGDSDRFPVSHTCFNELCLYEYRSKQKLIDRLSRAVNESKGFDLK